jgi:hypothetical protein
MRTSKREEPPVAAQLEEDPLLVFLRPPSHSHVLEEGLLVYDLIMGHSFSRPLIALATMQRI